MINPPKPPTSTGCYRYSTDASSGTDHQWVEDECLSKEAAARLPRPTIGGNSTGAYGISGPCPGSCNNHASSLVTAGSVSVVFPGACPGGVCSTPAPIYSETDSGTGRNASFSVQLNTNPFSITCQLGQSNCVPSDLGWVQFAYQGDPGNIFGLGGLSAVCVWTIDLTLQNYNNACMGVPYPYRNNNMWTAGEVLEVTGGDMGQTLWAMMCAPWGSGNQCWSVVTPDPLGLCLNPASSQCAWTQASGSLFGIGHGSVANFPPGVSMSTSVSAVSCSPPVGYVIGLHPFPPPNVGIVPDQFAGFPCQGLSNTLHDTIGGPIISTTTDESTNLTPALNPVSEIIQACFDGTCWITYQASD
jgi:hypothetical protein